MSLWNKRVEDINFEDIDNFLIQKQREGPRLDYKADIPKHLERLVAAFANTNGGLIILGVDADKKTNEPVWPRSTGGPGLKSVKGIEEQIHSICRDNINPPVRPHVSPPIDILGHPGHVIVVVRIDESPEAPHAIDGGRRIYERSGSQNEPCDFARIDRIQYLLERRKKWEGEREESIRLAIERATHQLGGRKLCYLDPDTLNQSVSATTGRPMLVPLRWASVIPYYPWKDLCSPEKCFEVHGRDSEVQDLQRAPLGSFATMANTKGEPRSHGRSMLTTKGHYFSIEWADEASSNYQKPPFDPQKLGSNRFLLEFIPNLKLLSRTLRIASRFYDDVERPGHILVSLGLLDARHYRMERPILPGDKMGVDFLGARFLDENFRADRIATLDELTEEKGLCFGLLDQLTDGFDLPRIPRSLKW